MGVPDEPDVVSLDFDADIDYLAGPAPVTDDALDALERDLRSGMGFSQLALRQTADDIAKLRAALRAEREARERAEAELRGFRGQTFTVCEAEEWKARAERAEAGMTARFIPSDYPGGRILLRSGSVDVGAVFPPAGQGQHRYPCERRSWRRMPLSEWRNFLTRASLTEKQEEPSHE